MLVPAAAFTEIIEIVTLGFISGGSKRGFTTGPAFIFVDIGSLAGEFAFDVEGIAVIHCG